MNTSDELLQRLHEQREILRSHAAAIDGGLWAQTLIAAVTIRNLVHTVRRGNRFTSHGLLDQLGVKTTMGWRTFGSLRGTVSGALGVHTEIGNGSIAWFPTRDTSQFGTEEFEDWWSGVVLATGGHRISRKHLVLSMANNDGGGHVDLDQDLIMAARAAVPQVVQTDDVTGEETLIDGSRPYLFILLRSVLTEVIASLDEEFGPLND